ncbi:MAG: FAD-dependent oxidoreductase, partial [Thermoguttaceae bacterium]
MLKLKIDHREVEVPAGATILEAAEKLGIEIPTLCFLKSRATAEGWSPATSCLVCLVKIGQSDRLVPACATRAAAGMDVASETPEVRNARKTALELLLSDHLGDCLAPCWLACPAEMNIPEMLRQIASGDLRGAIATVKADIALPAVLGRICPAPCEKVCRRAALDGAVSICQLKQCVADADLASADPYRPACLPATGRRVAVVGGGPTGLAAAYYLAQRGHAVTIFEEADRLGGRLLRETEEKGDSPHLCEAPSGPFRQMGTVPFFLPSDVLEAEGETRRQGDKETRLPREVLDAEIAQIVRLGVEVRTGCRGTPDLLRTFDAVLLAAGAAVAAQAADWGLVAGPTGLTTDRRTMATEVPGLFAAGSAVRGRPMVVRSVADGKLASRSIDQYLSGRPVAGSDRPWTTRIGPMEPCELAALLPSPSGRGAGGE